MKKSREEAYQLLCQYNKTDGLIRHALTVEAVMRHFAKRYQADADYWGVIGLIHDLDYEMFPQQHCLKTREIMAANDWDEVDMRAVESHGYGLVNEVEPISDMEKVLFTIDELTGLIAATALMRPSKSLMDLNLKSVKKKWKIKTFAEGVNREIIEQGCGMLGMTVDEVIEETILGMRDVAEAIGLLGEV